MLQILQLKTSASKLGVLLPNMSTAVTWHRLRVGHLDMYLTRKTSFKDTLFIGMHQGKPPSCAPGSCFELHFLKGRHPNFFPTLHVRKVYFEALFLMFWCPCYALVVMLDRWNQFKFLTLHRLYIWGHKWILMLLLTFIDWYKHSKAKVLGSKCIIMILIKISTSHKGLHKQFGLYIFPIFIGFEFSLYWLFICQIWSVYMQYLRCCDYSNVVLRYSTGWSFAKLFGCVYFLIWWALY